MPTYDFVCDECKHGFEALVPSFRARPSCPACGARRATRAPVLIASPRSTADKLAPALPTDGKPACGCGLIERPPGGCD
jgi:putative FmdB family regulatory protein